MTWRWPSSGTMVALVAGTIFASFSEHLHLDRGPVDHLTVLRRDDRELRGARGPVRADGRGSGARWWRRGVAARARAQRQRQHGGGDEHPVVPPASARATINRGVAMSRLSIVPVGTLAHIAGPGYGPLIAIALFSVGMGAAVGVFRLSGQPRTAVQRAVKIGLVASAVGFLDPRPLCPSSTTRGRRSSDRPPPLRSRSCCPAEVTSFSEIPRPWR